MVVEGRDGEGIYFKGSGKESDSLVGDHHEFLVKYGSAEAVLVVLKGVADKFQSKYNEPVYSAGRVKFTGNVDHDDIGLGANPNGTNIRIVVRSIDDLVRTVEDE